MCLSGLMGRRVYAKWGGAGENVDRELNIVAGWKVAECALRDVISSVALNGVNLYIFDIDALWNQHNLNRA
jgi:hypothetical protein